MVDDVMRAKLPAPGLRLRPRRGGDDGEPGQCARELNADRADAARAADDQQRFALAAAARHGEAVEQHLPCGDRGEREGGGGREVERRRFGAYDALVDYMKFA